MASSLARHAGDRCKPLPLPTSPIEVRQSENTRCTGRLSGLLCHVSNGNLVLLVEDLEDDILLIRRALRRSRVSIPLQVVRTGEEAIAYLSGEGKYENRAEYPLPTLVLLDLQLPGINGYDVLAWIRQQDGIRGLPVVVLTSSNLLRDVNRAYQLGANSFFVKDVDFEKTADLFALLKQYWIDRALTPENHRPARKRAGQ